jgi:hypothetical protein
MTEGNELEYYERREQQERALAARAIDPTIAAIHAKMAEDYAALIDEGRLAKRLTAGRPAARPLAIAGHRAETVRKLSGSLVSYFGADTPTVVDCQIKAATGDARTTWEAIAAHLSAPDIVPDTDV